MSETEDRKSMDDVLASIRRIVRSEKDPQPTMAADDTEQRPVSEPDGGDLDAPLALTPDMMMAAPEAPAPGPAEADIGDEADLTPSPAPDMGEPVIAAPETAAALDPEQVREMVREVVLEQISGDQAGELVRGIIRDELVNGEIGSNISQNVMALIKAEVGKALKG